MTSKAEHREQQVQALHGAFAAFTQVSDRLAVAYGELEARVATLTAELSVAQSARYHHLAEQERLAHRLHTLLNSLPAAVVVVDGMGIVTESNQTACDWFGANLTGQRWSTLTQPRCADLASASGEILLRDGRWVSVADCALAPEPGHIFVLADVTETRRLQADVERHRRLSSMGEMVASLAHQIRTPLATALLYSTHLEDASPSAVTNRDFATKITRSLRHLEQVVNEMLVFAKGGASDDTPVAVADALATMATSVEAVVREHGARLVLPTKMPDVVVRGSAVALIGALENIVTNAIQAGGTNVTVQVAVGATDAEAIVSISDDGPGMTEDVKERIFEPFYTTRGAGTGLGLAIARAVVVAHHGSITVDSTPGVGSTFVLRLPRLIERRIMASGSV